MEAVSRVVKVTLPNYLSHLPVPDHLGGIFKLTVGEWARLLPFIGTVSFFSWLTYTWFLQRRSSGQINPRIQKDCPKVVHGFDIEDLGEKMAFCRCWRSAKFPYCDGTHNDFNKTTGDNVGPLCIKRR